MRIWPRHLPTSRPSSPCGTTWITQMRRRFARSAVKPMAVGTKTRRSCHSRTVLCRFRLSGSETDPLPTSGSRRASGLPVSRQNLSLVVVEGLIVGQGLRGIKDMYGARHAHMDEADQLEVPCHRKNDREFVTLEQKPTRDAAGAVEACGRRRKSRTLDRKGRPYLAAGEEGNGVSLDVCHGPSDRLA